MILGAVPQTAQLLLSIFASDHPAHFRHRRRRLPAGAHAGVQVQTLSRVTFHALAPALVFNTLATSTLTAAEFGRMALVLRAGRRRRPR